VKPINPTCPRWLIPSATRRGRYHVAGREEEKICAPRSANASARSRPVPRAAPVMATRKPSRSMANSEAPELWSRSTGTCKIGHPLIGYVRVRQRLRDCGLGVHVPEAARRASPVAPPATQPVIELSPRLRPHLPAVARIHPHRSRARPPSRTGLSSSSKLTADRPSAWPFTNIQFPGQEETDSLRASSAALTSLASGPKRRPG
jgi:hypothetical protein